MKISLSKTTWLLIIAGILLIIGISVGMTRMQQTSQQKMLEQKLQQSRTRLSLIKIDDLTTQKEEIARKIADFEGELTTTKTFLADSKDSIDTTGIILKVAEENSVRIGQLSSAGVTTEDVAGIKCSKLPVNIRVSGNITAIADFLGGLTEAFPTSIIGSINLDVETGGDPAQNPAGNSGVEEDFSGQTLSDGEGENLPADSSAPEESPLPALSTGVETATVNIDFAIFNYKGD